MRKKISPGYVLAKQKSKNKKKSFSSKQVASAAVELGRLGGAVGGPARAEALSTERRSEIAAYAANIRWDNIERS